MKKEEILKNIHIESGITDFGWNSPKILKAMQEYADQQTKELQERVDKWKELYYSEVKISKKVLEQNIQLQAKIDELESGNKNKYLTCVDCGKQDNTVKDRGAFNGIQCYACKKEQDIDDEECR